MSESTLTSTSTSTSLPSAPVTPTAVAPPPVPQTDPFTPAQWKTLLAITDACIPTVSPLGHANLRTDLGVSAQEYASAVAKLAALTPGDDADAEGAAKDYLAARTTSDPAFKDELHRIFGLYMPADSKRQIRIVLDVLNTRAGSYALTGSFTPISEQPVLVREAILRSWAKARLGALRQLHVQLTILAKQTFVKLSPALRRVLGFPRVPVGMKSGKGYEFEFIQIPPGEKAEVIETDVVVVGSGCGGSVCAKNLAEAGHRVLVVEKAYHFTPDHFPLSEATGMHHLFMNGGMMTSDDGSINIIAGSAFSGASMVNWSASLQTQGYVRREWAALGLPFFTSAAFQDSLDRVCNRMGVSADYIQHNRSNQILMEGARKLGYAHKVVPQNTGGTQHHCGHCTFGCGSCEKQGMSVSYLPDAARAGAKFLEGFHAEKIIFSNKNGKKVATGVRGTWVSRDANGGVTGERLITRKVIIKAKRVIVSAGTMQSPLLLMRSGLKNPQIGRNLHLHPVMVLGAIHKEEIKPWEGPILTSVVSEYENLDGAGHGVKLETTSMTPSSWLVWLDWRGGLQYKLDAARLKHMVGCISICRDRDTGRVYPDPADGRVRVQYSASKFEKKHIVEGLVALAKIQYAGGATEIFTTVPGMRAFVRDDDTAAGDGINDAKFQAWLDEVRMKGLPAPESVFLSAHQMGTCRMAVREKDGVVDGRGQVWGVEGVFVADASVFPSASGVNPMVTNMAISDYISRGVAQGLGERARL